MKDASESAASPPATMVHRLAYTGYVAGWMVGLAAMTVGLEMLQPAPFAIGLLGFSATGVCYAWLKQQNRFTAVANQFEVIAATDSNGLDQDESLAPLIKLLEDWAALERQRGTVDFKPWAAQAARRDIQKLIDADPALGRLFQR